MAWSYFVVAERIRQTKKGPVKEQVVFGGGGKQGFQTKSRAEEFAENLSGPTSIHYLDTTQISKATQELRGKGVLKARKEGKDWSEGMVKFRHGKVS